MDSIQRYREAHRTNLDDIPMSLQDNRTHHLSLICAKQMRHSSTPANKATASRRATGAHDTARTNVAGKAAANETEPGKLSIPYTNQVLVSVQSQEPQCC